MPVTITASVALPVSLRSKLEQVRLSRAERSSRVPRLRDLIVEALEKFVDAEVASLPRARTVAGRCVK